MENHWYYITPAEYAEAANHGVSADTLTSRIRELGWDKPRAITTPPRGEGKYAEWIPIAKQNGISYSLFWYRVNTYGWKAERAATQPPKRQSKRQSKRQ